MPPRIITTVVTPADSYNLTDLATAKDELDLIGNKGDERLTRYIAQSSQAIAQYCNRVFAVETVQDLIYPQQDPYPYQVPGGLANLQLSRWPIVAVTSVEQDSPVEGQHALTQDADFKIDAAKGQLIRLNTMTGYPMSWEALPVTVVYSAGFAVIPDDLEDAALRWVTMRWYQRGRDPMMRSQDQPGLGTQTYWVGGPPMSGNLPEEIAGMLDNYRVPVVA